MISSVCDIALLVSVEAALWVWCVVQVSSGDIALLVSVEAALWVW